MKIKERINDYLRKEGYTEEEINFLDSASVYVAHQISVYAHRDQKRLNGDNYFTHPYNVMQLYRNIVGIIENDYFCMDKDLLEDCGVPYDGVQETCLLHDVLEDTDVTIEEIEEVFEELSLGNYFRLYIKTPLLLITHDKKEDYNTYISKLIVNPVAALVKFMDMSDNMNPSGLTCFGDFEKDRLIKYVVFNKLINDVWHFLEKADTYRKKFNPK
jgi:(p)ppGpp synthase/HD superfamily hydrolase